MRLFKLPSSHCSWQKQAPLAPIWQAWAHAIHIKAQPADEEQYAARQWLSASGPASIPRSLCDISYSRSSGPGGQNVNKTNSKATLRLDLSKIQPTMPAMIFDQLKSSRYYAHGRESLVIQSDTSRRQADNKEQCFTKLTEEIGMLARNVVTSETSAAQRTRVKNLKQESNAARLKAKKLLSAKKSSRRTFRGDE